MNRVRRYLYGWQQAWRGLRMARAGKQPWRYAIRTAACYRYLVDGQFLTPPRCPRYLRKVFQIKKNEEVDPWAR